jgi:branched-chain amino acid transport system ATP-binding protein
MKALKVENLSKAFGGVNAVQNVSFEVEVGERLGIIGPNGAGKTTLFHMLGGQFAPTTGQINFFDKNITKLPPYKRASLGISRSFQLAALFDNLSVLDNILLSAQGTKPSRFQLFKNAKSYERLMGKVEKSLKSFGLWDLRNEPLFSISYGEKRKLELALSLITEPKLLLLDEPTNGLTAKEGAETVNQIKNLGDDITVLFVAHDIDFVFEVAERILVLHYGQLITEGNCEEINNDAKVKEIYMGTEEEI